MASTKRIETILESWLTGLALGQERPNVARRHSGGRRHFSGLGRRFAAALDSGHFRGDMDGLFPLSGIHRYHDRGGAELLVEGFACTESDSGQDPPGLACRPGAVAQVVAGGNDQGPHHSDGGTPVYRRNGIAAWFVTHVGIFGVAWPMGWLDPGTLYDHYGSLLALLTSAALVFCGFLYWKGRYYPSSSDAVYTGNPLFDFFQGVGLHPQFMGFDLKQLVNCRVSMMGWSVICCCFLIAQHEGDGVISTGMWASVIVLASIFSSSSGGRTAT